MKKAYSARDEIDAQLVKGFLDEQGIESVVQADGLQQILGSIPVTADTLPSIWVRDEDVDRATHAIAGFRADGASARPAGEPWKCPKCGEAIEPQFTECWNCGERKPAMP